ncbi:MAG: RsmD family RNA methyltransferase, partial [Pseudomonadota bacterium]
GFTARRTKSGAAICFNRMGSHDLVDRVACAGLHPDITSQFDLLRQIARMAATRKAPARLFVTASATGLDIAVSEAREISATEIQQLGQLGSIARITWNGDIALQNEEPVILTDDIAIPYPRGAFLQATGEGQRAMVDFVKAATIGHSHIADLFAGCGTFSLPLTRHAHVTAFESDRDMLSAAEKAWNRQTDLKPLQTQTRDLFRSPLQASELNAFDAVVLDPPRAGAAAQVAEIAKSNLTRLVYVSCNPASFARDAKTLTDAGFTLSQIEAVDQFRWSPHIELMSVFTR